MLSQIVGSAPNNARRGRIALALALVGLGLFGTVAWRQLSVSDLDRAAARQRAAASCLLGDEDGAARHRLRSRAVAADLTDDSDWPRRCVPSLAALRARIDPLLIEHRRRCQSRSCCADDTRCTRLARLRGEVDKALAFARYGTDFDPTDWVAAARELGFDAGPAPEDGPASIAPAPLLSPEDLSPLFRGDYLRLLTDPDRERSIDLLFYQQGRRYTLCRLGLVGETGARCRVLDARIPVGLAGELLAGEAGGARRMYAQGPEGAGWRHALYDVDSGRELRPVSYRPRGGFGWRDGRFAWLGVEPPMAELSVFRRGPDGDAAPPPEAIGHGESSRAPRLFHDAVVWTRPLPNGRHHVLARRLRWDGLGPARVLAALDRTPAFEMCRTDDALVLLAIEARGDKGARGKLFLRDEEGWRAPQDVYVDAPRFGFTCRDRTATLSWILGRREVPEHPPGAFDDATPIPVQGTYEVHRLRCSPEGCRKKEASLRLRRHSKDSRYVAGDLGEAVVVLYRSPLGDVRMRVAPLDELASAEPRPLFDDLAHDGFGWEERDPIFGRNGEMVVLLSRQELGSNASTVYAVGVDASGTVTPIAADGP